MARRLVIVLDLAVKVALLGLLAHAILNPELAQYQGKAMAGRALVYPLAVPMLWWAVLRPRGRAFPYLVDLLFTAPFLIDLAGNALDLYDTVEWWDDLNHFVNWVLVTGAVGLALRWTGLGRLNRFCLAVGFAAVAAIGWEIAEYATFIRFSDELATAYLDTLGDVTLGLLGGTLAAALVAFGAPPTEPFGAPPGPTTPDR
jgi:hypothetical protein